jgi:hypothetical protein
LSEQEEVSFFQTTQAINNIEDFYVWSHHQRRSGLPFDRESWYEAREIVQAWRSANGEGDKITSSRNLKSLESEHKKESEGYECQESCER